MGVGDDPHLFVLEVLSLAERIKLAIVGPGGCGKDTAGEYLGRLTGLRYSAESSTSRALLQYVRQYAQELGCPISPSMSDDETYANRRLERSLWWSAGRKLQARFGETCLVRKALEKCDIVVGMRNLSELTTARREGLVDLVVWVERSGLTDSTLDITYLDADMSVLNNGTMSDFCQSLDRTAHLICLIEATLILHRK